jgi:hypothetical protein
VRVQSGRLDSGIDRAVSAPDFDALKGVTHDREIAVGTADRRAEIILE